MLVGVSSRQPPVDDLQAAVKRGPGLWTLTAPLSILGASFGRRMVIVSHDGHTGLISPVPASPAALAAALGPDAEVHSLIAPTAFHNFGLAEAARSHPEAACLVVPGVRDPGRPTQPLADAFPAAWQEVLQPFPLSGMPRVNETVIYDRRSRSLLVSDLVFNFDRAWDPWSRMIFALAGCGGRPRMSRLFRASIRDRAAFRASLAPVLALPLAQIIPAHGRLVTRNPEALLQRLARAAE
jgi:hypothetical protein